MAFGDTLTFDIETIPQRSPLSEIQQEELDRKIESYLTRTEEDPSDKIKHKLMATSPYFGEVLCVGLKINDESFYIADDDEEIVLSEFWKELKLYKGLYISYNGLKFDCPFLIKRSIKHRILPTNNDFLDLKPFKNFPHFDVQNVLANHSRYDSITLHLACEHFGIPSPKQGEVKAENVYQAYKDGKLEDIAKYCMKDVQRTHQLYRLLQPYIYKRN